MSFYSIDQDELLRSDELPVKRAAAAAGTQAMDDGGGSMEQLSATDLEVEKENYSSPALPPGGVGGAISGLSVSLNRASSFSGSLTLSPTAAYDAHTIALNGAREREAAVAAAAASTVGSATKLAPRKRLHFPQSAEPAAAAAAAPATSTAADTAKKGAATSLPVKSAVPAVRASPVKPPPPVAAAARPSQQSRPPALSGAALARRLQEQALFGGDDDFNDNDIDAAFADQTGPPPDDDVPDDALLAEYEQSRAAPAAAAAAKPSAPAKKAVAPVASSSSAASSSSQRTASTRLDDADADTAAYLAAGAAERRAASSGGSGGARGAKRSNAEMISSARVHRSPTVVAPTLDSSKRVRLRDFNSTIEGLTARENRLTAARLAALTQPECDEFGKHVFRRIPTQTEHVPTTAFGNRLYLELASDEVHAQNIARNMRQLKSEGLDFLISKAEAHQMSAKAELEAIKTINLAAMNKKDDTELDADLIPDPTDDDAELQRKLEIGVARERERERNRRELESEQRTMEDWQADTESAKKGGAKGGSHRSASLWVDKYSPRQFTDLLSPEIINREVLKWLKQWDECVFGHANHTAVMNAQREERKAAAAAAKIAAKHQHSASSSSAAAASSSSAAAAASAADAVMRELNRPPVTSSPGRAAVKNFLNPFASHAASPARRKRGAATGNKTVEEARRDSRPEQRVILLCGPPGLGKTTLAHVLVRHAGYKAVEINASDDRSAAVLEEKVRNATEMKSMFGDQRPNCLILDEIDGVMGSGGAPGDSKSAIDALIKIIDGKKKTKKGKKAADGAEAAGGQLNRPIICICNDQYAPALRPLRAMAKVFLFDKPSKTRLIDRLKEICKLEGLRADARALSGLCDLLNNDIRSCLNTLQFIHTKQGAFTLESLYRLNVEKDMTRDRLDVWQHIFNTKVKRHKLVATKSVDASGNPIFLKAQNDFDDPNARWQHLLTLLQSAENFDHIIDGLHENYLSVGYHDPTFETTADCAEWLGLADTFTRSTGGTSYSLYTAIAMHHFTAMPQNVKLQLPTAARDSFLRRQQNLNIVHSFLSNTNCFARAGLPVTRVVLDVVSNLLDVLAPVIRPVAFHLMSQTEKVEVVNLVDTLIDTALTYQVDGNVYGVGNQNTFFKLEPALDSLVEYDRKKKQFQFGAKRGEFIPTANRWTAAAGGAANAVSRGALDSTGDGRRRELNSKSKQMFAKEVEFEIMRRIEYKRAKKEFHDKQKTAADAVAKAAKSAAPTASAAAATSVPVKRLFGAAAGSAAPAAAAGASGPFATPTKQRPAAVSSILSPAASTASPDADASPATMSVHQRNAMILNRSKMQPPAAAAAGGKAGTAAGAGGVPGASPASKRKTNFLQNHSAAIRARSSNARQQLAAKAAAAATAHLPPNPLAAASSSSSSAAAAAPSTAAMTDVPAAVPAPVGVLHFKFHEGFTNAVRRPVPVSHFTSSAPVGFKPNH